MPTNPPEFVARLARVLPNGLGLKEDRERLIWHLFEIAIDSGHVFVLSEDRVVVELTPDQAEVLADPERQRLSASLADQFATVAGRSAIRAALSRKQEAS